MVMAVDRVNGVGGTVDRRVRDLCAHPVRSARLHEVNFFGMVNDDVVDIREVDFTARARLTAEA